MLSIETSGRSPAVLASRDRDRIRGLAARIVDAMDDPNASFAVGIDHIDVDGGIRGDIVFGDKSGGFVAGNNPPGGPDFPTEP